MANLDSRSKRASSVGIGLAFLLSPVLPDSTISAGDREHIAYSYSGIAALSSAPPEDRDDDVSVTARTDVNSATVRPIRAVFAHSADGARNADLTGFDRMPSIDRYRAKSSRSARNPSTGAYFEFFMEGLRGGEAFAIEKLVARFSVTQARTRAADTTARSDVAVATALVPVMVARVAADSERNADLSSTYGTVQDRWVTRLPIQRVSGQRFHIEIEEDGRGGNAWAVDRIVAWVSSEEASGKAAVT